MCDGWGTEHAARATAEREYRPVEWGIEDTYVREEAKKESVWLRGRNETWGGGGWRGGN